MDRKKNQKRGFIQSPFKGSVYIVLIMLVSLLISPQAIYAQDTVVNTPGSVETITGKVLDENKVPIIGASILIIGTKTGSITDVDGNFSIKVPLESWLNISYIGYLGQKIKVTSNKLQVTMVEDATKLEEVVVVGYGTQKVKNITGAISSVDMQKIESLPVSNLSLALSGQIPGLSVSTGTGRPGANDAVLKIRQTFDFSKDGSSSNPLIVIDDVIQTDPQSGLPSMDQFNRLDPSEVESITVLRDASAAIYGSRAAQGAVIVKTKRGKEGEIKVSYSGKFEWNDAVSQEKTLNSYDYGQYANSILRLGGKTESNLFSETDLANMKSLKYNWLDKAWSGAGAMQHSINVSGGGAKATYFAGASYYNQGANLGNQDYKRYNFRSGTDVKITKGLKLSATINATNSSQEKSYTKLANISDGSYGSIGGGEQADYTYLLHMPEYIPYSYNVNGVDRWVSPALGPHNVSNSQVAANQISAWNYFGLLNNGSKSVTDNFNYGANFALQYDIPFVKGLSVKATYALTRSSNSSEAVQLPYTLALATNTNTLDAHLYGDNTIWTVKENNKNSRVLYDATNSKSEQSNLYINYDRSFGPHNIAAVASIERSENSSVFERQFYDNPLSGAYNGASSSAGTLNPAFSQMVRSENGTLSYLGRVSYNYASKYLAQIIVRADASTNFAPENYWGLFPTVSLGWVASEETWFKDNVKWVDFLKVRASVGKTGKDNIKPWKWMQLYSYAADKGMGFGTNGGVSVAGVTPDANPNRDAHWDSSLKYNVGLDFSVLRNRLSFNMDGYFDRNTDMLTAMSNAVGVPVSIGGAFAELNFTAVDAWGYDVSINWKDKIGKVKYSIGVNTGLSWNKVKKYPTSGVSFESANAVTVGNSLIQPAWGFNTWKGTTGGDGLLRTDADIDNYWNYLTNLASAAGTTPSYLGFTDKKSIMKGMLAYQDLGSDLKADGTTGAPNGQVKSSGEDYAKLVDRNTNYGFSTNLNLSWKSFSWSAQVATSWGQYTAIDNVKQGTSSNQIIWSHESYWNDMYDPTNNVTGKYPNAFYSSQNNYASDFWQVSSFRCFVKNMSFSYSLPKQLISKVDMESVKISLSGNNLWDFTNPYPDNYRNMYDSSTTTYPTLRTWALGINLTF